MGPTGPACEAERPVQHGLELGLAQDDFIPDPVQSFIIALMPATGLIALGAPGYGVETFTSAGFLKEQTAAIGRDVLNHCPGNDRVG
jgi:hypothetical protein